MKRLAAFTLAAIASAHCWGEDQSQGRNPRLSGGVISYVENGERLELKVGKPCSDLWVSPDGSVIAFIAIEKAQPPTSNEQGPFIEESSVYVAWRSQHFRPTRLDIDLVSIDGKPWRIFRQPSVSPDLATVYFLVPYTMTTWRLFSRPLVDGSVKDLGDAMAYCVVWGGQYTGDLMTVVRRESTTGPPPRGVTYPCYLSGQGASRTNLADGVSQDCVEFGAFSARWGEEHGGVCRPNLAGAR
jgi:hypothetical protein